MNGITVNDTEFQDKSIALVPRPGNHQEVRITFRGEGTITDISKDDARALRDWLTAWLDEGKPVIPSYDENVTRLVEAAKGWRNQWTGPKHQLGEPSQRLYDALDPFLLPPDPDAKLVEKMAERMVEVEYETTKYTHPAAIDFYANMARESLAVVRAHDKEKT